MLNFRIQKHCDNLLFVFERMVSVTGLTQLTRKKPGPSWSAVNFQGPFARSNKMASAAPSSRNLLIEGSSDGEHSQVPDQFWLYQNFHKQTIKHF